MRIFENVDVEVQFKQSIEGVTVSDNNFLCANFVFVLSVNINRVVGLVVCGDIAGISSVLIHDLRVSIHHCNDKTLVVLCRDVVSCLVNTSVVVHLGHVVGFISAGSGNFHAV